MVKQKNSMDDIIIRCGKPQTGLSDSNNLFFNALKQHMPHEQAVRLARINEVPLPIFLKTEKEKLSEDEKKVQSALEAIYLLNDREVPIYPHFPKREKPLVIDITCLCEDEACGTYDPEENEIQLNKIEEKSFVRLIATLSHELKHAQQGLIKGSFNNYQLHQLSFLKEVQARVCTDMVLSYLWPNSKYPRAFFINRIPHSVAAETCIWEDLNELDTEDKKWTCYKDQYDRCYPIGKNDTPLTEIPPEFGIESQHILWALERIPKQARLPHNKALQAMVNNDTKALAILLNEKDKQGTFLINGNDLTILTLQAFRARDETNPTRIFETLIKSGRYSKGSMGLVLGLIVHLSEGEKLTDKSLKTRMTILKILLSSKTPKGDEVISLKQAEEEIADEKEMYEVMEPPDGAEKLLEHAEKVIQSMKSTLKETLRKGQTSTRKKTSAKAVKRNLPSPEI